MSNTMVVKYFDGIPAVMNQSAAAFEAKARLAMAAKLYELGRVSSGQAATLAGMNRVDFLLGCAAMGAPAVIWDDVEMAAEFLAPPTK